MSGKYGCSHLASRRRARFSTAAIALLALGCLLPGAAAAQDKIFQLAIPAEGLAAALDQIRAQTDSQIIYSPEQIGDAKTAGVSGALTVADALTRLLKNTNLTFKVDERGTIAIKARDVSSEVVNRKPTRVAEASPAALEEIVVTAQRREERAKDVAGSLTAISADTLSKLGVKSISDYAAYVPGLAFVSSTPGLGQITLRGVTTGVQQSSATVGTYIDDTPFTPFTRTSSSTTVIPDVDPFDVQRIEVLRGPQGTLYGAGAMGGLLKYVTTPPDPDNWAGRVELEGGGTENGGANGGARAMINAPISENTAFRMSAYKRTTSGFIDNVGTGNTNENRATVEGGRLSLLFEPSSDFSLRLSSLYQASEVDGSPVEDVTYATKQPTYGDLDQSRYLRETTNEHYQVHNLTAKWDLDWASLVSSTSYSGISIRARADATTPALQGLVAILNPLYLYPAVGSGNVRVVAPTGIDDKRVTQEFRLTSPSNHYFEWQLGAYYTHETTDTGQTIESYTTNGTPIVPVLATAYSLKVPSKYQEYAGFANIDYYLTEAIDLDLGIRRSHNKQSGSQTSTGFINNQLSPTSVSHLESRSSEDVTTYHIAPRWRMTDSILAYAVAASGYRPGGPNALPPGTTTAPTSFSSDTLWNYEAGFKTDWFDKALSLDVSAFYIDWNKIQLSSSVITPAGAFQYLGNGGKASSRGIELATNYRVMPGLTVGFNGAFTDAHLDEDAASVGGRNGDKLPTVPKWSFSLLADYAFPVFDDWGGSVGASYKYIGERNSGFVGSTSRPNMVMDSYGLVNLRAGLTNDIWGVDLFADNIFDKRGFVSVDTVYVPGGGAARATVVTPLTVGLRATRTF